MKKKLILLLLILITLILEILPYGAVLNFANPEGDPFRETYSYFSLLPFGYALFGPLLTAILTAILFCLAAITIIIKKDIPQKAFSAATLSALILSLTPLFYGIRYFSVVGALISTALCAVFIISKIQITKPQ